jgi:penicillin-binding protein 1B
MVGGKSYQESQFNRAIQARRQPGSVFKPVVYLAAFREEERSGDGRYRPTRRIEDSPFRWDYDGRQWMPVNYRGEYHGEVSLREALELSLNTATARLAQEVGLERVRDMAVRLGLADDLPLLPSIVLGSAEVTPLEVAEAYATIANLGFRTGTTAIRTVAGEEAPPPPPAGRQAEQVVSPRVAYLVTTLLEGVVDRGTGRNARRDGIRGPIAGKTGTTNDARDAWFVGFTPDLLAVVWVGFDQRDPLPVPASEAALPIWTDFMRAATGDSTPTPFLVPPGLEIAQIDPATGALATSRCPERIEETFLQGEAPQDACPLHPDPAGILAQPVDAPVTSFGIPAVEMRKPFSPPEALPLRQARP